MSVLERVRVSPVSVVSTVLLPVAFLLAGCSGPAEAPDIASAATGGATSTAGTTADGSSGSKDDPVKFVQCMRENGVDMPDPDADGRITIRGRPGDEATIEKAQKACRRFSPGGDGPPRQASKAEQEQVLRFVQCMRDHGIQMADPDFSGGGIKIRVGDEGKVRPDQDKLDAAQKACRPMLPEPPGGGSGSSGTGPGA